MVLSFSGLWDLLNFYFCSGERFKFGLSLFFLETSCTGGKSLMVGVLELGPLFSFDFSFEFYFSKSVGRSYGKFLIKLREN